MNAQMTLELAGFLERLVTERAVVCGCDARSAAAAAGGAVSLVVRQLVLLQVAQALERLVTRLQANITKRSTSQTHILNSCLYSYIPIYYARVYDVSGCHHGN